MTLYLRRRTAFSAGVLQALPGEGSGHDYRVELTVGGPIDPLSGMVVNIKDIDAVLKERVVVPLHGTLLDRDIPWFHHRPPTPENLARFIWTQCADNLPPPSRLASVQVRSSLNLWAQMSLLPLSLSPLLSDGIFPMLTLTRTYDFSASHRLHSTALTDAENAEIFGKCNWSNGHGHNYEVEVTLAGEPDSRTGRIVALDTLDALVEQEVLMPYDHRHLNYDAPEFRDLNPTSENLTRVIWDKLARRQSELGQARLYRVLVRETARNEFEYYGE